MLSPVSVSYYFRICRWGSGEETKDKVYTLRESGYTVMRFLYTSLSSFHKPVTVLKGTVIYRLMSGRLSEDSGKPELRGIILETSFPAPDIAD